MKIKNILIVLSGVLIVGVVFSVIQITRASPGPKPNPGHSWSEIGDFPAGCSSGQYISALGATPTCTAEVGDISGVKAGSGLTGGGTSGDVTLNVGAGTGISVAEDTVGLSYPSKSCSSGYAVQSFDLSSSAAPTCVAALPTGSEGQMLYNNAGTWTAFSGTYWDDTNNRLGIGTTSPAQKLDVSGYVRGSSGLCIGSDCRTSWPPTGGTLEVPWTLAVVANSPTRNTWTDLTTRTITASRTGNLYLIVTAGTSYGGTDDTWQWRLNVIGWGTLVEFQNRATYTTATRIYSVTAGTSYTFTCQYYVGGSNLDSGDCGFWGILF